MRALIYRQFGGPEVLEWVDDWPVPTAAAGGVLIETAGGGVNPKDILLRKGKFSRTLAREPLPRVSGLDVAGTVVTTGDAVADFAIGDRVHAMTNRFAGGVHAQYALVWPSELAYVPDNLGLVEAAAVPLAAQTALQGLRDCARLAAGQRVLIVGASGGVGHFAIQIARVLGAEVHAVCGPGHRDFVHALGAHAVYDYRRTAAPDIDAVYDSVFDVFGAYTRGAFKRQLGSGGIYVSTVPKAATVAGEFCARAGGRARGRLVAVRSKTEDLAAIDAWMESGRLAPHIETIYPVENAPAAHRHIESKHTTGQIVLSF